jgi:hypothetical protein
VTPFEKSIVASLLVLLALAQLTVIALALGWVGRASPAVRGRAFRWHRVEGYIGIATTLVIAYYCLRIVRIGGTASLNPARVQAHALLGTVIIGLLLAKVFIMRFYRRLYPGMRLLGLTLFAAILAIWAVSAGWYLFLR